MVLLLFWLLLLLMILFCAFHFVFTCSFCNFLNNSSARQASWSISVEYFPISLYCFLFHFLFFSSLVLIHLHFHSELFEFNSQTLEWLIASTWFFVFRCRLVACNRNTIHNNSFCERIQWRTKKIWRILNQWWGNVSGIKGENKEMAKEIHIKIYKHVACLDACLHESRGR